MQTWGSYQHICVKTLRELSVNEAANAGIDASLLGTQEGGF